MLLFVFTIMLGIVYPVLVTGFARLAFPEKATGSILFAKIPVGSVLIGQPFSRPEYFHGRPSATTPQSYNASLSSGSNLGPTNPVLIKAVMDRVDVLHAIDPGNEALVPIDLVTASGSGLDPHISPAAAFYQVPRIARTRGLSVDQVNRLVTAHVETCLTGLPGESRVNVLLLNLALNRLEQVDQK